MRTSDTWRAAQPRRSSQAARESGETEAVTAQVEIEALRRELDATLEALRQRDEFLALAAHELRAPLSPLLLILQSAAIAARRDPSKVAPALAVAGRQVQRLALLAEQFLDVARVAAGRLDLQRELVDLRVIVAEVVARFADEAERSETTIELACPTRVMGRWDALRLDQVVTNLVSNAVKYAPGAPVRIGLQTDERFATITVRDQGPGIPRDQLRRLFERFERAHDGTVAGAGLGLWIARRLVEAHGGSIRVISEHGQGATFVVHLPHD